MTNSSLSPEARASLLEKIKLSEEIAKRKRENRLAEYGPYAKQKDFHDSGATFRERLFMAGNQLGKTLCAANEVAIHLTGLYPDWWQGLRFDRPTHWLAGSESGS